MCRAMRNFTMRNVHAAAFVSLDGVMQAPGGPEEDPTGGFELGGWTVNYWDDVIGDVMGGIFGQPYDLRTRSSRRTGRTSKTIRSPKR